MWHVLALANGKKTSNVAIRAYIPALMSFTDGSVTSFRAGYGFCIPDLQMQSSANLPPRASSLTAEGSAILMTVFCIGTLYPGNHLVVSYLQSVLLALTRNTFSLKTCSPIIFKIRAVLWSLKYSGTHTVFPSSGALITQVYLAMKRPTFWRAPTKISSYVAPLFARIFLIYL